MQSSSLVALDISVPLTESDVRVVDAYKSRTSSGQTLKATVPPAHVGVASVDRTNFESSY